MASNVMLVISTVLCRLEPVLMSMVGFSFCSFFFLIRKNYFHKKIYCENREILQVLFEKTFSVPAKIVDMPQRYLDGVQICKGDAIMIRIPYKGRPAPKITWSVDGEVIEPSRRKVEIKTLPHHSTLVIRDTEKKDSGVYKFMVENSVGSDMVNIPVHVIGMDSPD